MAFPGMRTIVKISYPFDLIMYLGGHEVTNTLASWMAGQR